MSYWDDLQQASFRGVPFGVLGGEGRFGRRVSVHQYPMRDKPYVEDLGRSVRRISLTGFLVENSLVYGGGNVVDQRERMIAAAEMAGQGTLVHPTLGQMTVSVPADGLVVAERFDQGRYFELGFSFIESGDRVFPRSSTSSGSWLDSLAAALGLSAAADFVNTLTRAINLGLGIVKGVISLGNAVVSTVVSVAAGFAVMVGQAARDATSLANLAGLLTGNYGRYVSASVTSAYQSSRASSGTSTTTATLIATGVQDRAAVLTATEAMKAAAAVLDATTVADFPSAVTAVTTALLDALVNPADGVRLMASLASYSPSYVAGTTGQIAAGQTVAQDAASALMRRAAIGALAQAAANYVPSSYDDAMAVRSALTDAIDAEILVAGDAGDDGTYSALRALRQGVVAVLTASGADLSRLQTVSFKSSSPALAIAQRLYQDGSRCDQLISEADPIHPAFMPTRFKALSS